RRRPSLRSESPSLRQRTDFPSLRAPPPCRSCKRPSRNGNGSAGRSGKWRPPRCHQSPPRRIGPFWGNKFELFFDLPPESPGNKTGIITTPNQNHSLKRVEGVSTMPQIPFEVTHGFFSLCPSFRLRFLVWHPPLLHPGPGAASL